MPVNAPAEYFKAEEKFRSVKTREERILALEEMIRLLPRHHGSEQMLAQLKSRLAKLKKEADTRKGGRKEGIAKEGDAQICLIGFTQSGKSTLLGTITDAKPVVASHPFTTTKPEVGMMDYLGIKLQVIEIPSSFKAEHMSIARTADLIVLVMRNKEEERELKKLLADNYIRTPCVTATTTDAPARTKETIWNALGLMAVYTKAGKHLSSMALRNGATVRDFAARVHKDFVMHFRFARLWRGRDIKQVGLNYRLAHQDIVELHTK